MIENEVNKSGETFLQTILERSKGGVKLTVRAHPRLEQLMASVCDGQAPVEVRLVGREWVFGADQKATAYNLVGNEFAGVKSAAGTAYQYRLDKLGAPLLTSNDDAERRVLGANSQKVINLSFLRLVGISEGVGVSFEIKGVRTKEGIRELSEAIGQASRSFYEQYVRDLRMVATLSVMQSPAQGGQL